GLNDYWITKLDNSGNLLWQLSAGGTDLDVANCIRNTADGGYIVTGFSRSNDGNVTGNHGSDDVWNVKLGPDITGVGEEKTFSSLSIFPDPMADELSISSHLLTGKTEINIYNVVGEKVFSQKLTAKSQQQTMDVSSLARGIYFVKVFQGEKIFTKKV